MLISLKYIAIILKLTGAYLNKTYMRTRKTQGYRKETEGEEGRVRRCQEKARRFFLLSRCCHLSNHVAPLLEISFSRYLWGTVPKGIHYWKQR